MVQTRASLSARKAPRSSSPKPRARSPAKPRAKSPARPRAKSPAKPATRSKSKKAAAAHEFEFGGPVGALATMVSLPLLILALAYACDAAFCVGPSPLAAFSVPDLGSLLSLQALAVVLGWLGFQALLQVALPGPSAQGAALADGSRLTYQLNGHRAFWASLVTVGGLQYYGIIDLAYLHDAFAPLAFAACLVSLVLSCALYAASFRKPEPLLAAPGSTGVAVYDFFMGRELNPRIGTFDLKCFCELRPGLIGWAALNAGAAAAQARDAGAASPAMLLVNAFQLLYVWDALYFERSILTTMDITTDGFGYMLAFGDLAWVPFTYSLQARFLAARDPGLPAYGLAAAVLLNFVGYAVFRGANSQKDRFRRDPAAAIAAGTTFLPTKRGTKLITSGFWGAARKINYTGDWLMSLAWCLPCGFLSPIPYFYPAYFLVLLVHRALRDDHACAAKYGADWPKYKEKVPCLFVPYVV